MRNTLDLIITLLIRLKDAETRFWAKVSKTSGCWLWTGCTLDGGYGQFVVSFRERSYAHIFSYETLVGPTNGLKVLHHCDVRRCVRPDHLFLGTQLENVRDCMAKGRFQFGQRNGSSKLTEEQVRCVRLDQRSHRRIASDYGVDHRTIGRIKCGEQWTSVRSQK